MSQNENKLGTVSDYTDKSDEISSEKKRRNNFIARICALLLAVIMWFYVIRVDSPTYEDTFDYIPINLVGAEQLLADSGFSVISGYDGVVSVALSGRQSDITRLKTSDIIASADISAITLSGSHHLPVNIAVPGGIKVMGYEPTTLEVYVDSTLQRDIEVVPRITYSKEANVLLGEYIAEPAIIKVSGPATIVNSITKASASADFGKITKSMSGTAELELYDTAGNLVTNPYIKTNVSSVQVTVPVYKQKFLTPVVRFTDDIIPEEYIDVSFSTSLIAVQGEAEYIDALGDEMVVASIDPKQIGEKSTYEVLLQNVDDRLEYIGGDTITVDVSVDKSIRDIKRTIPLPLEEANFRVNGAAGASYSIISPEVLYIEARGINAIELDAITADDITLTADLSTINVSGVYRRDVVVSFDNSNVFTSQKYSVTFSVEVPD
ncbi:MAG: hypothetical protein E7588_05195 [Ruminococcaceae bacterium]|nr:hypothetical protein [Oscillospiraceae bacterium]